MVRQKRYITFYTLHKKHIFPSVYQYGLMCTRSWWKCMKFGLKHIVEGQAIFFTIEKVELKKTSYFN
jgi:hypothetical protein